MHTSTYKHNWAEISSNGDYAIAKTLLETCKEGRIDELGYGLQVNLRSCIQRTTTEVDEKIDKLIAAVLLIRYSELYQTQEQWETICRLRRSITTDMGDYDFLTPIIVEQHTMRLMEKTIEQVAVLLGKKVGEINEITIPEIYNQSYHPDNITVS